ncbi:MAG: branched-chain amino acid ABC transporter permease, partial [Betaproteobacteria bacterium]|nr:branched-chain amino acid ABC transporter permease [Betaproteobacteria bacterium]
MELLEYAIVGGILYGIFFTLVGLGLNLIFGVMRIINLAHGQFIVLGGYLAWLVSRHFGFNPLWAIPLSVLGAVVVGWPLYRGVVPRLQRSGDPEMLSFILFFGIGQILEAATQLAFGADQRSLPQNALGSGNLGV